MPKSTNRRIYRTHRYLQYSWLIATFTRNCLRGEAALLDTCGTPDGQVAVSPTRLLGIDNGEFEAISVIEPYAPTTEALATRLADNPHLTVGTSMAGMQQIVSGTYHYIDDTQAYLRGFFDHDRAIIFDGFVMDRNEYRKAGHATFTNIALTSIALLSGRATELGIARANNSRLRSSDVH